MTSFSVDDYVERLRRSGLKITPQRLETLRVLSELGSEHPSLNRVYDAVRERVPTVSFSTLYMTLRRLEELGLIRLFDWMGELRVEVNIENHINIVNAETSEIRDYSNPELTNKILNELGINKDAKILVNVIILP